MIVTSKKYPNAIITMDSAFYYYDLTDIIPNKTFVATNRNSNTIKNENIVQVWVPKEILNQGKEKVIVDGEEVNMYNKERLLVELIRKRNQIPFDYYKEIVANYRKIADELDMYKIEQYIALVKKSLTEYEFDKLSYFMNLYDEFYETINNENILEIKPNQLS